MTKYITICNKTSGKNRVKNIPNFDTEGPNSATPINNTFSIYYDIDAALGGISRKDFRNNINEDIIINTTTRRIQSKKFKVKYCERNVDIQQLEYENFGYINLKGDLKMYFFIVNKNRFNTKLLFSDYFQHVDKGIKNFAFNVATNTSKGIIFKDTLKMFTKLMKRIIGNNAFIYFETFGTKKIWYGDTMNEALVSYNKIIKSNIKGVFLDFCINIVPKSGICYVKNDFLIKIGETPNYFQYLTANCSAVSRFKEFYKRENDFCAKFNINKVNFYSSLQDIISRLTLRKYYPNLAKGVIFNAVKSRSNLKEDTLCTYSNVLKLFEECKDKTFPYRMEFRVADKHCINLITKIEKNLHQSDVIFYDSSLLTSISTNLNLIFNKIKESINIENLEKLVLLETLFVSVFLRGDIFKLPFSHESHRNKLFLLIHDKPFILQERFLNFYLQTSRNYVTNEFICSLNDFKPTEKSNLEELIKIGNGFADKNVLFAQIIDSFKIDAPYHRFKFNPIDFVQNHFLQNLNRKGLLSMLCHEYCKRYDDLFSRLQTRYSIYSENLKENVLLNADMCRYRDRQAAFIRIAPFINKPMARKWSLSEIQQLKFAKNIFKTNNGKFEVTEVFNNLAFDFHLFRTKKSLECKAAEINEISEYLIPTPLKDRLSILNIKDEQFLKDYKLVYDYDVKRLGG